MKSLEQKIEELKEGANFDLPMVSLKGKLSRVTANAVQLGGGGVWIPKSQIFSYDEITGEMHLSSWLESKLNEKSSGASGAY